MGFDIGTLGMQAAGAGIGGVLGLALQSGQDRRQIKQQGKLQELQIKGQKEMGEFNYEQQMKMWEATNYKAQMEQLKKAGLNPALLYGMSGGGGQTTASNPGQVSGGNAAGHSGEAIAGTGMGMQLGMLLAQQKLIEAQTRQVEAETVKTAGVDTRQGEAQIASLAQGVQNQKAIAELTKVQTRLGELDKMVAEGTITEKIDRIVWESLRTLEDLETVNRNNFINKATQNAQIDIVRRTAIGALLRNALTSAQTGKTRQETMNVEAERKNIQNKISMWAQENYIQLMNMSTEQRRTAIGEQLKDSKLEMQGVSELIDGISEILEGTMKNRTGPTRNPVGFK